MAQIILKHTVLYREEFLPAGTHKIDDKDVEAMRPYGEIIEEKPKRGKKAAAADDDLI